MLKPQWCLNHGLYGRAKVSFFATIPWWVVHTGHRTPDTGHRTTTLLIILVFLSGKTMNSYRRNHDIMGMLPIHPKAVERGLAPPDLFPHKSRAKIPVLSNGVSHQKQTPYPPKHENRHHEFKAPLFLWPCSRIWATCQNGHRNFKGVHTIQCICAVVVAAGAQHLPYDHRIGS